MQMTEQQKRALMVGSVGLGALLAAQAWRRRTEYDFAGKCVVITGGSRGLGLVMARELADEGARIALIARDDAELARAAEDLRTRQPFVDVQTVTAETSPRFHAVLEAFDALTGCPVLVNTSFNVRGEPIVCTPAHAYRCFMRTSMDYLVLGSFLLAKSAQPAPVAGAASREHELVLD